MTAESLATGIAILAAIPANAFPILYSIWPRWFRWRRTPEGRHLFWFTAGLALLIDLALIRRSWDGGLFWYDEATVVVFSVICWQLYRRVWFLFENNSPGAQRKYAAQAEAQAQSEEITP